MAGVIDVDKELARLAKELDRLTAEQGRLAGKLSNDNFVARAPADVVDKEEQNWPISRPRFLQLRPKKQDGGVALTLNRCYSYANDNNEKRSKRWQSAASAP